MDATEQSAYFVRRCADSPVTVIISFLVQFEMRIVRTLIGAKYNITHAISYNIDT